MILPDQRFDVPFNVDRIIGQAGCNESRRKIFAGNAGDIEQTEALLSARGIRCASGRRNSAIKPM